ncbi:MAG: sigma-54-dependent Fis family transcriptional regulator [bacterium]|nr:sigma-54-dependent Fis family transcriptional regulator [bacterium]
MQKKILIIDDNAAVNTSLEILLKQAGYIPDSVTSPDKAMEIINSRRFDLILQDMNFSRSTTGEEGLQLLKKIKSELPHMPVILITAWGSISLAVKGIRAGASDFVTKPWTNELILQSVKTSLGLAAAAPRSADTILSREELDKRSDFSNIIGTDPKFLQILDIISRVSHTDASVLITGESGTGKEVIAEAVHKNSERLEQPFIKVNLGGISTSLFESEMFGHVKGAFTDAKNSRKGRFELADSGTIFLDEIGDLELDSQVKLLRVLQDRTYEVLGSSTTRKVDVRVISATNRNINEMVGKGEFREDLLYRLNLIALHIPPLRERPGDIPPLAIYFLQNIGKVYRRHDLSISDPALDWLTKQSYPGNIRQLRQLIERTVLLTNNNTLEIEDFNHAIKMQSDYQENEKRSDVGIMPLDEMEKAMILKSIDQYNGNVSRIAEALGLSRAALYRRFEKFGIRL